MLRPTAIKVVPQPDKTLIITFDDASVRIFDVKPYIKGSWYKELDNPSYFNRARTDGFTVVWPDGQDICPDELFYNATPIQPD